MPYQPCPYPHDPDVFDWTIPINHIRLGRDDNPRYYVIKLWHDDIRRPPDDSWTWARTNNVARWLLSTWRVIECSLDYDLGLHDYDPDEPDAYRLRGTDPYNNGVKLVKWMIERRVVPPKVTIHSWSPSGATLMLSHFMLFRHEAILRPYEPVRA